MNRDAEARRAAAEALRPSSAAVRWGAGLALAGASGAIGFDALAARVEAACAGLRRRGLDRAHAEPLVPSTSLESIVEVLARVELQQPVGLLHPRLLAAERAALEAQLARVPLAAESPPLAVFFTSGTTGRPKGALLSAYALASSARAATAALGLEPGDRWLLAMPLAHVGGLSIVTRALVSGVAMVLPPPAERFDVEAVIAAAERERVTIASVVPTMLHRLLARAPRWDPPPHLRALVLGGAGAPASLLARAASRGWPVLTTYGLTEASAMVSLQPRGTLPDPSLGAGLPLEGVELRVVERADEREAERGVGELCVRGPSLMDGYLGVERAETFDAEGWFGTGDVARFDAAGRLHVLARRTDLVVSGGENVYPAEVEDALLEHAAVAAACVFGVPDEEWGEVVAAAVVLVSGGQPTRRLRAELAEHLGARLAPHKRPRRFAFVAELATGPSGKLDRRATRALAGAALDG